MTEQEANAAVDAGLPATPAVDPNAQPTIDTSVWNDAETAEPLLAGPCSPVVTIAKFGPAASSDGHIYGWSFDLVLDEEMPTNLGGKFPVGKSFNYLKVFTVAKDPNDTVKTKAAKGKALKIIAALNGVEVARADSAPTIVGKMQAAGATALSMMPSPQDRDQSHYDQHVGKKVKAFLRPDGLDRNGYPQVALGGMAPVAGATQSPY